MATENDDFDDNPSPNVDCTLQTPRESESVTPLHDDCEKGATLEVEEIKEKDDDDDEESKSVTPLNLHDACKRGATLEEVKELFILDPESVKNQDNGGMLPLHYACENELPFEVIEALIYLYPRGLSRENKFGKTPFEWDCKQSDGDGGGHFKEFLNNLVRRPPSSSRTEMADILAHCKDYVPIKLSKIGFLDEEILKAEGYIRWISDKLCSRYVVAVMVLEFYCHILWIYTFVSASYLYETDQSLGWRPNALIAFASIALLFELVQMEKFHDEFMLYCLDPQNWLDLTTIIMMLVSAVKFRNGDAIGGRMLMATGCLQSLFLLSYLKKTFFPFYKFVSGVAKILIALVPFLVVSVVTLFTFSFMYFIRSHNDEFLSMDESKNETSAMIGNTTLMSSFQIVVENAGFSSDTSSPLGFLSGIIIIIVLLNVVIAVVSEEWENVGEGAYSSFWEYRIRQMLQDIRGVPDDKMFLFEAQAEVLHFRIGDRELKLDISPPWVGNWEETFVHPDGGRPTMENIKAQLKKEREKISLLIECFLLIVLGFPLCGVFWPKFFRQFLFLPALPKAAESELGRERLEDKVNELSQKVSAQNDLLEQLLKKQL
mmetsp:Transcript_9947/g.17019  ORF Transcript_9947/g.17019 Transcript_9947/m.17019 type:complete len:602 (-) Transcript_9947:104-1909(-)